ncbi:hypothetical protein F5B21DRAFT_502940 [Xylaria acuta]|nr:hypothetical protein F5B21DRAFT_502940 [Xylaria acuta]
MPALVTLPTEIIRNICDQLVPDVIVTGTALPLPDEHQLCQRALWSLTLVSRHAREIATEFLYKNVVIQSTKQMVCLFRTICNRPELRGRPRYLANLVPLMDSGLQWKIEGDIQRHFPLFPAIVTSPTNIYPREMYQLGSSELFSFKPLWTHEIIRYMLIMLPRLEDILTSIRSVQHGVPPAFSRDIDEAFFADTPSFPPFSDEPRTLRIQWELRKPLPGEDDEDIFGPLFQLYFAPYISNGCRVTDLRFLNLANVTSYKVEESSSYGLDAVFGPGRLARSGKNRGLLSWLAQLKTLDLGFSAIDPEKVGRLLAACPSLKKLRWEPFSWSWNNGQPPDSSHVVSALKQTAGQLEELNLLLDGLHGPISFRHFRALKVLSVGIEVLTNYSRGSERTGDDPATSSIVETPLASLLPDNLNHLTLTSTNFRPKGSGRRRGTQTPPQLHYRDVMDGYVAHGRQLFPTWLADGLEVFSRSCQAMSNFYSITVVQPFHNILPVDHIGRIEVGNLTAGFGAAGVQFSTELTTFSP